MLQTRLYFLPHDHQCVLLNGWPNGPFGKRKMGRKGRVSSVPSSRSLFLYKGDHRPYFRLLLCYYFVRTLKNFSFLFYLHHFLLRWPSSGLQRPPFFNDPLTFLLLPLSLLVIIMMDETIIPILFLREKKYIYFRAFFCFFQLTLKLLRC